MRDGAIKDETRRDRISYRETLLTRGFGRERKKRKKRKKSPYDRNFFSIRVILLLLLLLLWTNRVMNCGVWGLCGVVVGRGRKERRKEEGGGG